MSGFLTNIHWPMESQSLYGIGTMHQADFIYPYSIPNYEGIGGAWNGFCDSASAFSHPDNVDNACGGPVISSYSSLEHVFEPRSSSYRPMHQLSSRNFSHGHLTSKVGNRGNRSQTTPVAAATTHWGGGVVLPQVTDPFHGPQWPFSPGSLPQAEYAPSRPSSQREEHIQHDYVAILPAATPAFPGRSWGLHEAPANQLYAGVIGGVSRYQLLERVFEPMRSSPHPMLQSTPSNLSHAYHISHPVYRTEGSQTFPAAAVQPGPDGGPPSQKAGAPYVPWQPMPGSSSSSHAYHTREPGYRVSASQTFPEEAVQRNPDGGPPHPPQRTDAPGMPWQPMSGFLQQPQHHLCLPLHKTQAQIEPDFGGLTHDTAALLQGSQCLVPEAPTSQLYAGDFWGVSGDIRCRQIVNGGSVSHYPPKVSQQRTPGAGVAVSTVTSPSCAFRSRKRKATDEGPSPGVETTSEHIPCRALDKDDPLMQRYLGSTFDSVETATTAFFEANRFSCPVTDTCPFVAGTDGNIWVHLTSEHREVSGKYKRRKDFQCPLGCAEEFNVGLRQREMQGIPLRVPLLL
ncbi:hypothetical protein DFP72DRAFT_1045923 [Ephemerocybe angulata]|uniref:Uncharacterized protein n=1 Tax=Ephemerocybe angulata TaxID=980116 RepID=A0A8H6HXJ7_9AGAR|nr:hypothetical protein DFP72DRAFT_1045923 [Tulosesus angulatus]